MQQALLGLGGLVCTLVFAAIIVSVLWQRERRPASRFHRTAAVELAWTLIPMLIVLALALPAIRQSQTVPVTAAADLP